MAIVPVWTALIQGFCASSQAVATWAGAAPLSVALLRNVAQALLR